MGIFYEMATIINRSPVTLSVTFDGQTTQLTPGRNALPKVAVNYAKNQNPVMGSADPLNPSMSGVRFLVGVEGQDDCEPLTQEEWLAHCEAASRMDLAELYDGVLLSKEHVEVRGKGRKTQARGSADRGVRSAPPSNVGVEILDEDRK